MSGNDMRKSSAFVVAERDRLRALNAELELDAGTN